MFISTLKFSMLNGRDPSSVSPSFGGSMTDRRLSPPTPAPPGGTGPPVPPRQPVPVLWLALLATPVALGGNAPVLILARLGGSLGVPVASATWLVTVFAWAMTVGTPLFTGLIRHQGPRTGLAAGAAAVGCGTALVVLAPSLPVLLGGRALQGAGGAGLAAVAMNLAGSPRRMGVLTAGFGICAACGPLLGARLAWAGSWRAALALSALSLLAFAAVRRRLPPRHPSTGAASFDVMGAVFVAALATALSLLPIVPSVAAAGALATAVCLALHVRRRPDGFVPAALLASPAFVGSALAACAVSTSYFAQLYSLPRLLEQRTGWSTDAVGTGQLAAMLTGSALAWLLAAGAGRMGTRRAMAVLAVLAALAPLTAALAVSAPLLLLSAAAAILAATGGNALLSVSAAGSASAGHRPAAIGLCVLCYQLGGALGPALATLLVLG